MSAPKTIVCAAVAAVTLPLLGAAGHVYAQDDGSYEEFVQRYEGWTRSDVEAAGYTVDAMCIDAAGLGLPAELGAMGFHAVNPEYAADGEAQPEKPDVLLLDGDDKVIGIEFEIPDVRDPAPTIAGVPLALTPPHPGMDTEHMSLHIYFVGDEDNRFTAWNASVSCPEGTAPQATGPDKDSPDQLPTAGAGGDSIPAALIIAAVSTLLLGAAILGRRREPA